MAAQPADSAPVCGETIRVRGLVQGVGFRPTVWRLASECGLSGEVRNDAEGVLIRAWGRPEALARFRDRLRREPPPLARIDALESAPAGGEAGIAGFHIAASQSGEVHTGVVADAATCAACLAELDDAAERRHGYAFTNCTHCGPRLSIVQRIPYDRANTSMTRFDMCPRCLAEYRDPADRRFHAQPNACPACGPRLWLERGGAGADIGGDPVDAARRLIRGGHIVAIKGIGGIHLACDAGDDAAVARLRRRKHRYDKPFALMARDIDVIRRYCTVDEDAAALLRSPAAPIVLLEADGGARVAGGVAPGQRCLGFMLPYSPLHHLLMAGLDAPIVLTSGNRSEEPQCIEDREARERLGGIADGLLLHDRDIVNRLDDSVARIIAGAPALIRRARGYAPAPLRLPAGFTGAPPLLALGGELKNTFCLVRDNEAILSQHLGDLENAAANAACRETLDRYLALFEHRPAALAVDSHPDYLSAKLGREWADAEGLELIAVQHHHAHVAACLADNGVDVDAPPALGIALDGLGYGDDGSIWGGEFLLADYRGCRRLAALAAVPMPGAVQAIREPWRMAYAHLRRAGDWPRLARAHADLPFFRDAAGRPLATLDGMIEAGLNCPATSSCGRLFDAVAAVMNVRRSVSYEGQAAIELEALVDRNVPPGDGYPFDITHEAGLPRLDPAPMWAALLDDLRAGVPVGVTAARFHFGLAGAIEHMIEELASRHGDAWRRRIVLSGGVFQNAVFSEALIARLEAAGMTVLRHARVPANDGGLSLGQAAVAAARLVSAPHPNPSPGGRRALVASEAV